MTIKEKKNVLAIIGSASQNSANQMLIYKLADLTKADFNLIIYNDLKDLPHFDPELSIENTPKPVLAFRQAVEQADGIIICTPEYIFSIPAGLKNAIEWCVSTTVFSGKPTGLITASLSGQKGHEELQLIMKTLMTVFTSETTLLIPGIKGKINKKGEITDAKTVEELVTFAESFKSILENINHSTTVQ
ncbi:MAG: NADPH-dependent FMN reductase [Bacteroidota bacterium]